MGGQLLPFVTVSNAAIYMGVWPSLAPPGSSFGYILGSGRAVSHTKSTLNLEEWSYCSPQQLLHFVILS